MDVFVGTRLYTTALDLIIIKSWVPVRRAILAGMKDVYLVVGQLKVKDFGILLDPCRSR